MKQQPIFVVGVQRSGTTLLAAMLAAHSRLSCGPETHFFRWLSRVDTGPLCDRETWPLPAVEFLRSVSYPGVSPGTRQTLCDKYQLDGDVIQASLQAREPSIGNVLRSVTEHYMREKGKVRWVEKTPDHLLHLESIREFFPDSPIIQIVRDPRDVALALMNVPWGMKSLLGGLLHWERLNRLSREFLATDGQCCTVRFEDLVATPVEELRKVCQFIGEAFEERMLDTSTTGREINSQNAPWKLKVSQAPDVSRVAVWRSELTKPENQLAEALLGDQIEALGYPREEEFVRAAAICPGSRLAAKHAGALETLASDGVRFWKARPDERFSAKVYLGEPDAKEWLGEQRGERVLGALPVLADIAKAAISRSDVYWIPDGEDEKWAGCVSFVLRKLLAPYKVRVNTCRPGDRLQPDVR